MCWGHEEEVMTVTQKKYRADWHEENVEFVSMNMNWLLMSRLCHKLPWDWIDSCDEFFCQTSLILIKAELQFTQIHVYYIFILNKGKDVNVPKLDIIFFIKPSVPLSRTLCGEYKATKEKIQETNSCLQVTGAVSRDSCINSWTLHK